MATKKKSTAQLELPGQPDATAPLDWQHFLAAAQPVVTALEADLQARAKASPSVQASLVARHQEERAAQRTGDSLVEWTEHFIEQVAAAWLLSAVFVRTLEDRGLLGHNRLGGPGAQDSLKLFLELAPSLNERDYLLTVFRELQRFPATQALFDARHNPVWLLTPSAEAARRLLHLFQQPRADVPAYRFGQSDTGFLGWLYQDLNASVRERFALLQTPRFVEEYILDRTLEPAIAKFGLDDTTLIDPTCGSGHFLLGAFERLFDHRLRHEPGLSHREAARKALDAVYGADLNPYAVGIARFRLTLAFLEKAGFTSLREAPALPLHLVVADSLLHNPQLKQPDFADIASTNRGWRGEEYALEDEAAAKDVLHRQFAAVVGNPPYITVRDPVLRERYREQYPKSAAGKYSVAAPFTERFFQLAKTGGRVGMITANSFMKREFGKKLIEQYLPTVNLDLVVNTSGAYIPGHGTPTVLLFGSHEAPVGTTVHTVLANRGEPATPEDAAQGLVWRSIADHTDETGFENDYISVTRTERGTLEKHPWSLGGGGAAELKELLEEKASGTLGSLATSIGFMAIMGEDDVFIAPREVFDRAHLRSRGFGIGELVRDWAVSDGDRVLFDYSDTWEHLASPEALKYLWPFRDRLAKRLMFGKTQAETGNHWSAYRHVGSEKVKTPLSITFAFVATHNHFVLDRGGKVFKQSAPIVKLPDTATEDDHLALLAYLNSSTACFWMKQVFYPKATSNGDVSTEKGKPEANRYEFAGTGMLPLPIPTLSAAQRQHLIDLARRASLLAETREQLSANWLVEKVADGELRTLDAMESRRDGLMAELVALQEEIDWLVYEAFGLAPVSSHDVTIAMPSRPFEWTSPTDGADAPPTWRQRHALIHAKDGAHLRLLEQPVYKRLWSGRRGVFGHSAQELVVQVRSAAREWVEARAEDAIRQGTNVVSIRALAREIPAEAAARIDALLGSPGMDAFIHESLREAQAVPFLAAWRYTESGLERFAEWEHTWALQRREDAGETIESIPVPPKYGQGDFRSPGFYKLRGPLDVPKERFISYPGCESDEDGEPVYGWAGWDHEQRARALATLYVARRDGESWSRERLTPMLAGLLELLPWLKQWHGTPNDDYGGVSPGSYYEGFLDEECRKFGLTTADLRAWRPATKAEKAAKAKAAKVTAAKAATASMPVNQDGPAEGDAAPKKKRGRPKNSTPS